MTEPQPTQTPKLEDPKFGFNDYAERLNGRAAMIGFVVMRNDFEDSDFNIFNCNKVTKL